MYFVSHRMRLKFPPNPDFALWVLRVQRNKLYHIKSSARTFHLEISMNITSESLIDTGWGSASREDDCHSEWLYFKFDLTSCSLLAVNPIVEFNLKKCHSDYLGYHCLPKLNVELRSSTSQLWWQKIWSEYIGPPQKPLCMSLMHSLPSISGISRKMICG